MRMRSRGIARLVLSLVAAAALAAGVTAPAGADTVPDDQPLPGYTVNNPPLPPAQVGGAPTRVFQGVHGHAAYTVEVPPRWNGELVMWAHGFRGQTKVLTVDPPAFGLRQRLLDQGYAWAASSYYANGYDVRAGVLSTRDLAKHAGRLLGHPSRTYLAGVSMGGHITARSLEQFPGEYDGALPMCGVLGDHELFDFFLDYHLVAQALAGERAYPPPDDYLTAVVPRIQHKLGLDGLEPGGPDTTNDRGKQLRVVTVNRSGGPRPGAEAAFASWKDFLFTLVAQQSGSSLSESPGQVATNVGRLYQPNAPVDVNAIVQRVPPDNPVARRSARLSEVPQVFGRPRVPVLTLHGLGDLFVPFSMERIYEEEVARNGRSPLLVQRAIRTVGHCEFSPNEAGAAWDDLVRWVRTGERPAGDDVATASVVATPEYGCRFSDPAAYENPPPGSSRRLFAPCPP